MPQEERRGSSKMQHPFRQKALSNSSAPRQKNSLIFIIVESYIFRQGGIKKSQNYLIFCLRKQVFKKKKKQVVYETF